MDSLSQIRVRGKRAVPRTPPQRAGLDSPPRLIIRQKRRQRDLADVPCTKKRRRSQGLSALESLPTELLEQVLLYSMEISLPLSSHILSYKLSSSFCLLNFSIRALSMPPPGLPRAVNARTQARLIASRFFTASFLKRLLETMENQIPRKLLDVQTFAGKIHIPLKVLHGPWTSEKLEMLSVFLDLGLSLNVDNLDTLETYNAGILDAIKEDHFLALQLLVSRRMTRGIWSPTRQVRLLTIDLTPERVPSSTHMLRKAVIDHGCNIRIVCLLLLQARLAIQNHSSYFRIDSLDQELWTWADRKERDGDPKGEWLKSELRSLAESSFFPADLQGMFTLEDIRGVARDEQQWIIKRSKRLRGL